ncbi:MAG: hypothetical protein ACOC6R_03905, partial [Chloroflexota bacterium]
MSIPFNDFLNFPTILVLGIEQQSGARYPNAYAAPGELNSLGGNETFFCYHLHDKICILKVFVGESMRIDILCLFPEMFASPL